MVTSLDGGGFTPTSQKVLIVLTGVTLLVAALSDGQRLVRAMRSPLVVALVALGALSIASAAWTVGSREEAARWGLVILAYGGLAACSTVLAARITVHPIAAGLAILAGIEAVLGLRAVALHALPDAQWIDGSWRPGGSFEYPPALGFLQVAALPVLLAGLARARSLALLSAVGAVLAGATLGCTTSRLDLVLGAIVLAIWLLWPPRRSPRRAERAASVALVIAAGVAGHLILGRQVPATQVGGGSTRMILITGICAVLALEWLPIRSAVRSPSRRRGALALLLAGLTVAMIAGAGSINTKGTTASANRPIIFSRTDLTHGRLREWKAAWETWLDRPVLGAGAGAYYQASAKHQGSSPTLFAHNLPLELAAELGAFGLLLAIGVYAASFDVLRKARSRVELWLLGPAVCAFLIANLLDWPWHLAGLGAVWAVAAGALGVTDPEATPALVDRARGLVRPAGR